jgi:protocatechuate 3,4-dioxygenase beta subunit
VNALVACGLRRGRVGTSTAASLDAVRDENYRRGVQETAAVGAVTFTSTFPGCYDGRWPHIHWARAG